MADEHDIAGGPGHEPVAKVAAKARPSGPAEAPSGSTDARSAEGAIEEYRRRIDQIDDQLMRLLNSRSACAVEIGRLKRRGGLPVYQPEREKWILDRAARNNPGPLDSGAVQRVFERVIDESRRLERLAGEAERGEEGD
jgi:chorismate mutase